MREIQRVKVFFNQEVNSQLVAFHRRSKTTVESQDSEIEQIFQFIMEEMSKNKDLCASEGMLKQSWQRQQNQFAFQFDFNHKAFIIKLQTGLNVSFQPNLSLQHCKKHQIAQKFISQQARHNTSQQATSKIHTSNKQEHKKKKAEQKEKQNLDFSKMESEKQQVNAMSAEQDDDQNNDVYFQDNEEIQIQGRSSENESQSIQSQQSLKQARRCTRINNYLGEMESQRYQPEIDQIQVKKPQKKSKAQKHADKQIRFWNISQKMKILSFLLVNKDIFLSKGKHLENQRIKNAVNYIGTQKDSTNCSSCIQHLITDDGNKNFKRVQLKAEKLHITESMLKQCRRLEHLHMSLNQFNVGQQLLVLCVHPVLQIMPPIGKLKDELKRVIKNGPFLQAKLRVESRKEIKHKEQMNEIKQDKGTVTVIKVPKKVKFRLTLSIPFQVWKRDLVNHKEIQLQCEWKLITSNNSIQKHL